MSAAATQSGAAWRAVRILMRDVPALANITIDDMDRMAEIIDREAGVAGLSDLQLAARIAAERLRTAAPSVARALDAAVAGTESVVVA